MRRSGRWRATELTVALVLAAACGDDGAVPRDGGPDAGDGGTGGPLAVAIEGPAVAYVGEETCFLARQRAGAGATYTWIWGDETRDTIADGAEGCHAWAYPGEMLLSVVVEAGGMRADASVRLHVVFRPSSPPPSSSSPIVVDAARGRVWVVNPDADTVAVLAADPPALVEEIAVGRHPRTLTVLGDHVVAACQGDGTLHVLDAETGDAVRTIDLGRGTEPYGVVADPRGGLVHVSLLGSGEVALVSDLAGAATIRRIEVGPDPRGLAVNADGVLLVTRWRSDDDGARVITVDAADPEAPAVVATALLPPSVDVDSDTDNDGVFSFLNQILFSPDGGRALIPALKANVVAGTYRVGRELTSQTTARGAIAEVMLRGGVAEESFRFSFDDLDFASSAAFSPEGERLYVAFQGAEAVLAVDPFAFNVTGSIDEVGHAPQGLAVGPDGRLLYVQAFLSREVRVYDVSGLSREPDPVAVIPTVAAEPLDPQVLAGKIVFYRSRDPRMSRTSYLSCASCHLDGDADGLVWDFTQRGEGLRNTISLLGRAGTGHGPLHWSANFDEVQDFEHDIRAGQGGTGFLSDDLFHVGTRDTTLGDPKAGLSEELDALAAYVTSLDELGESPHRRDGDAEWEAAFARGQVLFESAETACATCHAPPRYTDSAFESPGVPRLHDVGTLGEASGGRLGETLTGLDTPTLRGLWRSAPYLHDGSAATLREVLVDRNPDDRHGVTSALSEEELGDLVTFLSGI